LATIVAHLPCCGPLLLAALGGATASAGWLAALAPLRPYLLGLALLQVVGLFVWAAIAPRPTCCEEHAAGEGRRRYRLAWVTLAVVLGIQALGVWLDARAHGHSDLKDALHLAGNGELGHDRHDH